MMDSRPLLTLSREGMAQGPFSLRPLQAYPRAWSAVIFSVLQGTVTEGRATDDLLKKMCPPILMIFPHSSSQLLPVPPMDCMLGQWPGDLQISRIRPNPVGAQGQ